MAKFTNSKGGIKQVIRGTVNVPAAGTDVTIPSVNLQSAFCTLLGFIYSGGASSYGSGITMSLSSSTNLHFRANSIATTVTYEIVEFYS